jgi:hypothetical protein
MPKKSRQFFCFWPFATHQPIRLRALMWNSVLFRIFPAPNTDYGHLVSMELVAFCGMKIRSKVVLILGIKWN